METIKFSSHKERLRALFPHLLNTISLSGFVFPGVLYQFVDLAHRAIVTDTCRTSVINAFISLHLRTCKQKPIGKKQHIFERKTHELKMADFNL